MRQHKVATAQSAFSILTLDDDPIMTATLQDFFKRAGYRVDAENDPNRAIERVRTGSYDILLLDFLMSPICGDQVVEQIRKFNSEIFIIMLTGHKSMAPPIRTIRTLDIQGYYEKSDRFDQLELLVESCVKSIRQMRTIKRYQGGLSSIMDLLPEIYHLQSVENIADDILHSINELLSCTESLLVLESPRFSTESPTEGHFSRTVGNRFTGQAETLMNSMTADCVTKVADKQILMPLLDEQKNLMGLVGVELDYHPGVEERQLMEVFARQASAALSNGLMHSMLQEKNNELDRIYQSMRDSYAEMVVTVRSIVDAKDFYTRGHSDRVAFYSVELAKYLRKDETYCARLEVAGLFHDIGKLSVPDVILLKDNRLTDLEYSIIKTHCTRGYEILSSITHFHDILPAVRGHHEWYDGSGYPDGLIGEQICEQARIIAIADAFDAMTSNRRYRSSLGFEMALNELSQGKGTQFDPEMVDAFVSMAHAPGFFTEANRVAQASEC